MGRSIIYKNIGLYRLVMNILYLGRYHDRFSAVIELIKDLPKETKILELCFADTHIARFCRSAGFEWQGLDINEGFVNTAKKAGFNATIVDLTVVKDLPKADVCIMMGSLYHFKERGSLIIEKMLNAAKTVIISEPTTNLTSQRGVIGFFARRAANAGKGNETFRYTSESFSRLVEETCQRLHCQASFCRRLGKDSIVKIISRNHD